MTTEINPSPGKARRMDAGMDVLDPNNIFVVIGIVAASAMLSQIITLFAGDTHSYTSFVGLVFLCGTAFVVTGKLLYETSLTAETGKILVSRMIHMAHNWRNESLRSTMEICIWLAVISWTLNTTERRDLAVVYSTLTGIFVALVGEYMTNPIKKLEKVILGYFGETQLKEHRLSSSIPILLIYALYATSQVVAYANDIITATSLAAATGLALTLVSIVANAWKPTRNIGESLHDRMFNASENWRKYPTRSMAELSTFLGVTLHVFAESQEFMFAVRAGVTAGILVCVIGDVWIKCCCCRLLTTTEDERVRLVPTGFMAYLILITSNYVFTDMPLTFGRTNLPFFLQLFMFCSGAITYLMLGRLFMRLPGTKYFGCVLQHRIAQPLENWETHPLRSALECGTTNLITWAVWCKTDGDLIWFITTVMISGPLLVLCSCVIEAVLGIQQPIKAPFTYSLNVSKRKSSTSFVPTPVNSVDDKSYIAPQPQMETMPLTADEPPKRTTTKTKSEKLLITWAELSQHNTPDDAYLLIQGEVYDVTKWLHKHPGGSIITKYAGADATDQFAAFHRPKVAHYLKAFHVATLAPDSGEPAVRTVTEDYRKLRAFLYTKGFFEPDAAYYNGRHVVWASMLLTSIGIILCASNVWVRVLLGGGLMGLGWQQAGFLAHDAAHHGIKEPPKRDHTNMLAWFLGNFIFGISSNMWNEEHSMHHAITIRPREDPQFFYLPICMISEKELINTKVDGPNGYQLNPFIRAVISVQEFVFLPIAVLIGRVNIYVISIFFDLRMLFKGLLGMCGLIQTDAKHDLMVWQATMGLIGLACFHSWHAVVLCLLPTNSERVAFFLMSHWVAGILHIQLLLSHMNVDTFTEEEERAEGFAAFQIQASRNIDCYEYEHWFHGGLEYQIEHHLFPQLPRHSLAKVQPYVQELCAKHDLPYRSGGFVEVTRDVVSHLGDLAKAIVTLDQ